MKKFLLPYLEGRQRSIFKVIYLLLYNRVSQQNERCSLLMLHTHTERVHMNN